MEGAKTSLHLAASSTLPNTLPRMASLPRFQRLATVCDHTRLKHNLNEPSDPAVSAVQRVSAMPVPMVMGQSRDNATIIGAGNYRGHVAI